MEITHDLSRNVFEAVVDGYTAYVSYAVVDGVLMWSILLYLVR